MKSDPTIPLCTLSGSVPGTRLCCGARDAALYSSPGQSQRKRQEALCCLLSQFTDAMRRLWKKQMTD